MRLSIVAIGRMKDGPERELISRYIDRAAGSGKPLGPTGFEVSELPESRAGSAASRKADEAKAIRAAIPDGAITIALDEHGKTMGSEAFAGQIARWRDDGKPGLSFVIGGADGLDVQRRVADAAPSWLAPGGCLLVETSERQAPGTVEIFTRNGLSTRVARCDELDATVVIGVEPASRGERAVDAPS